ncbi:hypothetical protein E1N52_42555 [Paraburkholderia guartelaensis]|uniref:Uncharacterized protein n=1 Tax=Paraburkholderia guartelaensis TaxID=2546446 RepID=A0A4R5L2S1_9BURK|nr:hypothetical protein [Paraburkholderia guartelaensis]TDG01911.1 hypothetical protein E1N52_42555 [Paraburkholderia guartelaensis]
MRAMSWCALFSTSVDSPVDEAQAFRPSSRELIRSSIGVKTQDEPRICGSVDAALASTLPGSIIALQNSGYPVKENG